MESTQLAIIGSNLTALLAARAARSKGLQVTLIDDQNPLGGYARPTTLQGRDIPSVPHFIPFSEENLHTIETLRNLQLLPEMNWARRQSQILFCENSHCLPFVGFGDAPIKSHAILQEFTAPESLETTVPPEGWVASLLQSDLGQRIENTLVTSIRSELGSPLELTLNGSQKIAAEKLLFTDSPRLWLSRCPEAWRPARLQQKVARTTFWQPVTLHLVHAPEFQPKEDFRQAQTIVLYSPSDEFEPVVGALRGSSSVWIGFINSAEMEDTDLAARLIKHMKRQVKRAFGDEALSNLVGEKIVVHSDEFGYLGANDKSDRMYLTLSESAWAISPQFCEANSYFCGPRQLLQFMEQTII